VCQHRISDVNFRRPFQISRGTQTDPSPKEDWQRPLQAAAAAAPSQWFQAAQQQPAYQHQQQQQYPSFSTDSTDVFGQQQQQPLNEAVMWNRVDLGGDLFEQFKNDPLKMKL